VVVFVSEARRRGHNDDRLLIVVTGALVGGALLMRLGTWLQHVDLRANASFAEQWAYGNRSVLSGLVGAWLGVHIAKRLSGYQLRTGDLFAPAVAIGMAVGRVGCLLTEEPGTPTGASWGISLERVDASRLGTPASSPGRYSRARIPPASMSRTSWQASAGGWRIASNISRAAIGSSDSNGGTPSWAKMSSRACASALSGIRPSCQ
jgi:hypothetical protein